MAQWQKTSRIVLAIGAVFLFLIFAIFPTIHLIKAFSLFQDWVAIQQGPVFFVILPYQDLFLTYSLAGIIGLASAGYIAFRKERHVRGLLLAICISIGGFFLPFVFFPTTPDYDVPIHANHGVKRQVQNLEKSLKQWSSAKGRFPRNQKELAEATQNITLSKNSSWYGDSQMGTPSLAFNGSKDFAHLPYKLYFTTHHPGPYSPNNQEAIPATIFYSTSTDLQKAWLTGMGLRLSSKTHVATEATVIHTLPLVHSSKTQKN